MPMPPHFVSFFVMSIAICIEEWMLYLSFWYRIAYFPHFYQRLLEPVTICVMGWELCHMCTYLLLPIAVDFIKAQILVKMWEEEGHSFAPLWMLAFPDWLLVLCKRICFSLLFYVEIYVVIITSSQLSENSNETASG